METPDVQEISKIGMKEKACDYNPLCVPHILDDGDRSLMNFFAEQIRAEKALTEAVKKAVEVKIDIEKIVSEVRADVEQSKRAKAIEERAKAKQLLEEKTREFLPVRCGIL